MAPAPVPAPGVPVVPPNDGASPVVAAVMPLYRVEVAAFSAAAPVAQHVALATLGTFHERRGEQALVQGGGALPATWGRVIGQRADLEWDGTVAPGVDGDLYGIQAGLDLFGRGGDGVSDQFGLFAGYARLSGDVNGQALGWNGVAVGDIAVDGTSLGAYWTRVGASGWYIDAVLMGTWFSGDADASSGQGIDVDGSAITTSVEGGYPVPLSGRWTIEPQAQAIWTGLSLDDTRDDFSTVDFDDDGALTGRIGVRLQGERLGDGRLGAYLKANLWHGFPSDHVVRFDSEPVTTELEGTALELGGGIVASIGEGVALFAIADYTTGLGSDGGDLLEGSLGLNLRF